MSKTIKNCDQGPVTQSEASVKLHKGMDASSDHSKKVDPFPDITLSLEKLGTLFRKFPKQVDTNLLKRGESLIGIFEDPNFSNQFQNIVDLKKESYFLAGEDVAKGVSVLRSSVIGITFHLGALHTYILPHGTTPQGNVVFSISWKDIRAFQNYRKMGQNLDVNQEDINHVLYYLAWKLAQLPDK